MNIIQQIGTWQEQCQTLNYNFRLIATEIDKLKEMASKDAGFYDTATDLLDAFPVAEEGMRAFVKGENYSGTYDIYGYHEGSWADTGENFTTSVYLFDVVKRVFLGNSQAPVIPSGGDVTIPLATATSSGLFPATDKVKIDGLPNNDTLVSALANKVDKVSGKGLSENDYTTTEKNKLAALPTSSELNTTFGGKVDSGKGILALALAAGFTYDAQTGTYTRSWISDVYKDTFSVVGLTEEEVGRVIAVTSQPVDGYGWCSEGYRSRKIRCTGAVLQRYYRNTYNANGLCLWQSSLEVFYPCRDHIPMKVSNASHMFDDCTALRRTTAIDVSAITSTSGLDGMFNGHYSSQTGTRTGGCTALVDTFIKGLKVDFSLSESPNISLRSLQYLVDNAANTGAITVLLEQSRYIMVQNSQAEAYVNLRNAAAAKNISFGTI